MLKVCLLEIPHWHSGALYPPLASAYLKCALENGGRNFSVELSPIFDPGSGMPLGDRQIVKAVAAAKPDVVGLSLSMWNIERSLHIAGRLKSLLPDLRMVAGGPEVWQDNDFLLNNESIDYLLSGEGERSFHNLCRVLSADRFAKPSLAGVAYRDGLWQWPEKPQSLIEDLDEIPSPHLRGILGTGHRKFTCLEIARGCIYKCIYCNDHKGFQGVRYFSIDRITAEIRYYLQKGVKTIYFIDPTFSSGSRLEEICEVINQLNPQKKLEFRAELRAEHIDVIRADLLKKANFVSVEVGLQSAAKEALDSVNRSLDKDKFLRGIQLLLDRKIQVGIDLMIGLPGDSPQ